MNIADTYVEMGQFFVEDKDYNKAIDAVDKAIKLNPQHAKAYCIRGSCYFNQDN